MAGDYDEAVVAVESLGLLLLLLEEVGPVLTHDAKVGTHLDDRAPGEVAQLGVDQPSIVSHQASSTASSMLRMTSQAPRRIGAKNQSMQITAPA